jgi:outer membrane immunogenic protein
MNPMRLLTPILALLLPVAAMVATPVAAPAQSIPAAEVALTYNWVHTNAPPKDCGCFSMNGGSGSFAYNLTRKWAVVGEVGAETNGNVNSTGLDLTLADFLVGGRYTLRNHSRLQPFGQILLGAAHTSGSLSPDQIGLGAATSFATTMGGGVDVSLSHRIALRVIQADYFLTLLPNGSSDRQNNLRLSAGFVFRFGSR